MGKIRVSTIGDESLEQEEKNKKELKKQTKLEKKSQEESVSASPEVKSEEKTSKEKKTKFNDRKKGRSKKYKELAVKVDKNKTYSLDEALTILPQLKIAKFDETVELHINTSEKGISGQVTLPHGTGKDTRVAIVNPSKDQKASDELISKINSGTIEFDVLIATPDAMPLLARVAKVLGPRGLMPNPKNGTISPKPEEAAKNFAGGQVNYKTESKFPIIHLTVGKMSFGDKKLKENITTYIKDLPKEKIKNVTLKSTMSPGLKIQV